MPGECPNVKNAAARVKPDVVLYEEGLDQNILSRAVHYISEADVLIIGGTSLVVYPAAGLIDYYRGNKLVLVNKTPTARDAAADLVVQGSIGEILHSCDGRQVRSHGYKGWRRIASQKRASLRKP